MNKVLKIKNKSHKSLFTIEQRQNIKGWKWDILLLYENGRKSKWCLKETAGGTNLVNWQQVSDMIRFTSDSLRSKDGQRFTNLQKKLHTPFVEQNQSSKITKALNIPLLTVHSIVKRIQESGDTENDKN